MRIDGKNFSSIHLQAKGVVITEADRPVRYMRGWELKRVVRLAERWHWQITLTDDERAQLSDT